jgi:hypothetical protein
MKIAVIPTTLFRNPPRGEYDGGGALIIVSGIQVEILPFRPAGPPSCHYTCATGVLLALQATDPAQTLDIATPLEYVERKIQCWNRMPAPKRSKCKVRTPVEHISRIMYTRPYARVGTCPTNDLHKWSPPINDAIINSNPDRWWRQEEGGTARDTARHAARDPISLERLTPDITTPTRLLLMDVAKQISLEGHPSRWINARHDREAAAALATHHTFGVYFGLGTHPGTWDTLRHSPHRSLFIKARIGLLAIGQNLVDWRLHLASDRDARCVCDWHNVIPTCETLQHLLFECPLNAAVAKELRTPLIDMETALGRIPEIRVTPTNPTALKQAFHQQKRLLATVVSLWEDRKARRAAAHDPN